MPDHYGSRPSLGSLGRPSPPHPPSPVNGIAGVSGQTPKGTSMTRCWLIVGGKDEALAGFATLGRAQSSGAGDGNRTRTVSLGIALISSLRSPLYEAGLAEAQLVATRM